MNILPSFLPLTANPTPGLALSKGHTVISAPFTATLPDKALLENSALLVLKRLSNYSFSIKPQESEMR